MSDAAQTTPNKSLAERICDLFGGDRANGYKPEMRKDDSGKTRPVEVHRWTKPPSPELWRQHLAGKLGLGVYATREDGLAPFGHADRRTAAKPRS